MSYHHLIIYTNLKFTYTKLEQIAFSKDMIKVFLKKKKLFRRISVLLDTLTLRNLWNCYIVVVEIYLD